MNVIFIETRVTALAGSGDESKTGFGYVESNI